MNDAWRLVFDEDAFQFVLAAACARDWRYRLGARGSAERYTALRDVISEKAAGFFKKLKTDKLKSGNGSDLSISESQDFSISASQNSVSESQRLLRKKYLNWTKEAGRITD